VLMLRAGLRVGTNTPKTSFHQQSAIFDSDLDFVAGKVEGTVRRSWARI